MLDGLLFCANVLLTVVESHFLTIVGSVSRRKVRERYLKFIPEYISVDYFGVFSVIVLPSPNTIDLRLSVINFTRCVLRCVVELCALSWRLQCRGK
jgi:hypothetical protein